MEVMEGCMEEEEEGGAGAEGCRFGIEMDTGSNYVR